MERLRRRWIGVELGAEGGVGVGDSKGWGFFEHGWRVEGRSRWEWGGAEVEVQRGFWMEMQDRTGGSRGTRDGLNQDEQEEYDPATRTGTGVERFAEHVRAPWRMVNQRHSADSPANPTLLRVHPLFTNENTRSQGLLAHHLSNHA